MHGVFPSIFLACVAVLACGTPPDSNAARPSPTNCALRFLDLESSISARSAAGRDRLEDWITTAAQAAAAHRPGTQLPWTRRSVISALTAVDRALIHAGAIYPATGAVGLLSEALIPYTMPLATRASFESSPCNQRRRDMIAARFPGPFHLLDCDLASIVYLGVAEEIGLPLSAMYLPSHDGQPAHVYLRWQEGTQTVNWETNDGSERVFGQAAGASRDAARRERLVSPIELKGEAVQACGHYSLAVQHERRGEWADALRELDHVLQAVPDHLDARRRWAWNTATAPGLESRDHSRALEHARRVVERCPDADAHDTLAAVHASAGDFDAAIREARAALAVSDTDALSRVGYRARWQLYRQGLPYRQPAVEQP